MGVNLFKARYVCESAHCAVLTCDEGQSYVLGYFNRPRHAWTYVATFDQEAAAERAFEAFDRAASIWNAEGALTLAA
jgi:hypothetical protein